MSFCGALFAASGSRAVAIDARGLSATVFVLVAEDFPSPAFEQAAVSVACSSAALLHVCPNAAVRLRAASLIQVVMVTVVTQQQHTPVCILPLNEDVLIRDASVGKGKEVFLWCNISLFRCSRTISL